MIIGWTWFFGCKTSGSPLHCIWWVLQHSHLSVTCVLYLNLDWHVDRSSSPCSVCSRLTLFVCDCGGARWPCERMCPCSCVCPCWCVCVCVSVCLCVCVSVCICLLFEYLCACVCKYFRICAYTETRTYAPTHNTHTHTDTQTMYSVDIRLIWQTRRRLGLSANGNIMCARGARVCVPMWWKVYVTTFAKETPDITVYIALVGSCVAVLAAIQRRLMIFCLRDPDSPDAVARRSTVAAEDDPNVLPISSSSMAAEGHIAGIDDVFLLCVRMCVRVCMRMRVCMYVCVSMHTSCCCFDDFETRAHANGCWWD